MTSLTSLRSLAVLTLGLASFIPVSPSFVDFSTPRAERLVAESGGRFEGLSGTNSQEALDRSYEIGFRLIHLDFEWTTDQQLILLQDWGRGFSENFLVVSGQRTLAALKALPMRGALTALTAESLVEWLERHPDVSIVADVKSKRLEAFRWLAQRDTRATERFFPLVETVKEYDGAYELGYRRLFLSVTEMPDREVVDFTRERNLFAVLMPPERALAGLARQLGARGVRSYARSVNDGKSWSALREAGVSGAFTDRLEPTR